MTVRNHVIRGAVASEHIVQFFDTDESRADIVASFLDDGYQAGEPIVVVARPANWALMTERLQLLGVPVHSAIANGSLVVRDANQTLDEISRFGSVDAAAFEAVVGKAVMTLGRRGRVRAYGEMVDMLAQRGELAEAIKLEGLWNDLGERASSVLMCGYSAAHFVSTSTHRALLEICKAHSGVNRHAQDPLANWLLTAAHNGSRASARSATSAFQAPQPAARTPSGPLSQPDGVRPSNRHDLLRAGLAGPRPPRRLSPSPPSLPSRSASP